MDKEALLNGSKKVFEYHKNEDVLIATSDGNYFLKNAESLAKDHARKRGLDVMKISRQEAFRNKAKEAAKKKADAKAKAAKEAASKKLAEKEQAEKEQAEKEQAEKPAQKEKGKN